MNNNNVNVWLVNTGWTGGPYGIGSRMKLKYTRAMINAVLNGKKIKISDTYRSNKSIQSKLNPTLL